MSGRVKEGDKRFRHGVTILPAPMLPRFLDSRSRGIPAARIAAVHKSLADALDDLR